MDASDPRSAAHSQRSLRARLSLEGLATGDAFGECFFGAPAHVESLLERRALRPPPWRYTDDTVMALAITEILEEHGRIEQDALAERFGRKYLRDPARGYGGGAHGILSSLGQGGDWRVAARSAFEGMGSMGNGGAMRADPVGAFFADDLAAAARNAGLSAEVTHAHPEGVAGAIAVAVAAGWVASHAPPGSTTDLSRAGSRMFEAVLDLVPDCETRAHIARAAALSLSYDVRTAVAALGNGSRVIAQDTVPFALWCAARHLGNYEEALWTTVSGLGDRDTTCAIAGGIVVLSCGVAAIPSAWVGAREPLAVMAET
ncbi:MAG: ADP-ribosylglycohydrolase family protein [Planctomycetes bacterium]|nr:ADP-ribosylglycohydrolase family protein [Planctomycetota bacterium]